MNKLLKEERVRQKQAKGQRTSVSLLRRASPFTLFSLWILVPLHRLGQRDRPLISAKCMILEALGSAYRDEAVRDACLFSSKLFAVGMSFLSQWTLAIVRHDRHEGACECCIDLELS